MQKTETGTEPTTTTEAAGVDLAEATYQQTPKDKEYLEKAFKYHPPKGDQAERYAMINAQSRALAELIIEEVPPSRERSLALTALEESKMWANAGIARNE
jgi:hypothetical protein